MAIFVRLLDGIFNDVKERQEMVQADGALVASLATTFPTLSVDTFMMCASSIGSSSSKKSRLRYG